MLLQISYAFSWILCEWNCQVGNLYLGIPKWHNGKEYFCQYRRWRDPAFIPGLGRSPGIGNGNSLQYYCLENSMDRGAWWAIVHGRTQTSLAVQWLRLCSQGREHRFDSWSGKIPWMEEPCRLQSMESLRVGYDWVTSLSLFTFLHWRSKWQPTPVFLPGESQGRGSLVGCRLWVSQRRTRLKRLSSSSSRELRSH